MRRRSRLLIGLAAAAITFGSLSLTMGFDHWDRYSYGYGHHGWSHHHCESQEQWETTPLEEGD